MSPDFLKSIESCKSESDIENKLLVPLLKYLGYNDDDWQAQLRTDKGKPDFIVNPKEQDFPCRPYIIIEAKAPDKDVNRSVWQITQYMGATRAVLGLLTNGNTFYLLCNYNGRVAKAASWQREDLVTDFTIFFKLLCKETCLKFNKYVRKSYWKANFKLIEIMSQIFKNDRLIDLPYDHILAIEERNAMIITVSNHKGGVGKTTLTINLAAALNSMGKKVLLIDIDPQANLTTGLGTDPLADVERVGKKDITHLLTESKTTLEDVLISKRWHNIQLDMVPSHIRLCDMESTLNTIVDVDRVLERKLRKYKDQYDFIFIDPPPSFGKVNTIALMASGGVLIPTQLSPYPIRALEYVMDRAFAVDDSRDEPLSILGLAVSMYDRNSKKLIFEMCQEIDKIISQDPRRKAVELFPDSTWIPRLNVVSISPLNGQPLCEIEHNTEINSREKEAASDAWNCYTNLANHLINKAACLINA